MASAAQIKANQQNSKKSTGPKTAEGKYIASQNALLHGILSTQTILPDENEEGLQALRDEIFNAYRPTDTVEFALVERILLGHIRQSRLQAAEAAKIKISMTPDILIKEINQVLGIDYLEHLTLDDLTDEKEKEYAPFLAVEKEFEGINIEIVHKYLNQASAELPLIWGMLQARAQELGIPWDEFSENPILITKSLKDYHHQIKVHLRRLRTIQTARSLMKQLNVAKRIPEGKDFEQIMRYQTQIDNEILKATERLRMHREEKIKTIEGELVDLD